MSEASRNKNLARAALNAQGRSDSPWSQRSIHVADTEEEILDKGEELYNAPSSSRSHDAASMYGMSPASYSQSSWRRPSGASNLSATAATRRPSGASATSRRPSSSSGGGWSSKVSVDSGHSLYTASAQSPTSPPSTPRNRSTSSRSKILASSAAVLEHSPPFIPSNSPPPPHSRNSSFSTDISLLPRSTSPASHKAGKGAILVSTATGQSLLERKRRLAAASGSSAFDDGYTDASSISTMSQQIGQHGSDQASNVSSADSSGTRRLEARRKSATKREESAPDHIPSGIVSSSQSDSPVSLKKKLFGGSKKEKVSPRHPAAESESNIRNVSTSSMKSALQERRPQPSRMHSYTDRNRPSTSGSVGSPSLLAKGSFDQINGSAGNASYDSPYNGSKLGRRTITESASYPKRQYSGSLNNRIQDGQSVEETDYSRRSDLHRAVSSTAIETRSSTPKRASLRSVPSEHSIERLQNDPSTTPIDRPASRERGQGRKRANSRGSASVHSIASFGSTGSVPTRTTSLKQARAAPSSPGISRATLVSPSSSYKSIPTSPDLLPSAVDTTLSSSPIKNSLNRSISVKHSSWRQSSALSTAAAAGPSGASALAAIRASFGEPQSGQHELDQEDGKRVGQADVSASLSFAALRILEEPGEKPYEVDGGRDATMSKLIGVDAERKAQEASNTVSELHQLLNPPSTIDSRKEPLRPSKSPLRSANADRNQTRTISESGHGFRSVSAPTSNTSQRITPSNSATTKYDLHRIDQLSPPRKSIEEMSVVDVMMQNEDLSASGSTSNLVNAGRSKNMLRSRGDSQSNTSAKAESSGEKSASSIVLLNDDGAEGEIGQSDSKNMLTSRYKTLRKVTPPIFNMSFGNKNANKQVEEEGNVSNNSASNLGHVDEHGAYFVPASSTPSSVNQAPRKKSIWRLGSNKEENLPPIPSQVGETLPTTKSKLGMSIRGRKHEPPAVRPTIRRVFDQPLSNDSLNSISVTGDSSMAEGDDSKTATPPTGDTSRSFATMQSISNDSLQRQLGIHSSSIETPGTPQTPSDSLPGDTKRLLRRCNAIRELVETERSYASDLAIVRDLYLGRAKLLSGLSTASPLATPLSSTTTPILTSGLGTPITSHSFNPSSSSSYMSVKGTPPTNHWGTSTSRHQSYTEAPLASPAQIQTNSTHASSSGPSNRSSTYTASSHASSDLSFHWPPNGNSLPGTPSVGPPSTNKSTNASSASPAPSLQQQQQQTVKNASMTKIQTSLSGTPTSASEGPLSARDMRIIFAHLESTCAFAHELHSLLNSSMGSLAREKVNIRDGKVGFGPNDHQDDDRIGQLFVTLMPRIENIFTAYCSRHEASMLRLQEVISNFTKAATFFRDCSEAARKNTTAWDLGSLLIKPVQRVLKYPLLLRQIVNLTEKSHPDYAQLNSALVQIEEVADKINRVKRRRDLADLIIAGKDRDAKGNSSPLASMPSSKNKKKGGLLTPRSSNIANAEDSMLSVEALDNALEKYASLTKDFEALQSRVSIFGRQCGAWSHALRECYYAQLRIMGCLRKVYNLRITEEAEGGQHDANQAGQRPAIPSGPEDAVVSAYMEVMKTIINRSWRQMDTEIQTAILPMTSKIERMFEAPRLVMAKRDERENDFARARLTLHQDVGSGKNLDRKLLENANGFVALQAQLIDELPIFMRGIQLLLDVGVQAFARLQAGHLDEVRHLTIDFWRTKAGHADEVEMIGLDGDDSIEVGPTLRNVHPVRAFWDSHRVYSQWSDSLSIARRGSELSTIPSINYDDLSDSDDGEDELEEAIAKANSTGLLEKPSSSSNLSHGLNLKRSTNNSPSTNSNSGHNPAFLTALNAGRRPSGGGVAGLMRTLSGTFSRDNSSNPSLNTSSETELPPMPDGASNMIQMHRAAAAAASTSAASQNGGNTNGHPKGKSKYNDDSTITVSSLPPSLPSLIFRRDGDTGEGFFVQNKPIDFLDTPDHDSNKEPYDLSPAFRPVDLHPGNSPTSHLGVNGVEMTSDPSSLSFGTDGNTSTRSSSFVSAESARTLGMPSRENSADRMHVSKMADMRENDKNPVESENPQDSIPLRPQPSQSSQRQKMKALFQCKATKDGPERFKSDEIHLGWQFVQYKAGDTFRVLSRDTSSFPNQTLLFGRSDITGSLGWVEGSHFSEPQERGS